MEMHALGRLLVNSRIWNFFNQRYVLPILLEHLVRDDYQRVLDIGCGIGYTTQTLASRFPRADMYGIDYDKRQIRAALRRHSGARMHFSVDDGKHLHFPDGSFDAVFVFDTMHHIEQYEDSLREIFRVLHKGGELYVLDIDKRHFRYFSGLIQWIDNTQSLFSRHEFLEATRRQGFTVSASGEKSIFFYVVCRK